MFRGIRAFFRRTDGQDLAEYCLLLALVGLIVLGFVVNSMGGIQGIWASANRGLTAASTTATTGAAASSPAPGGGTSGDGHSDGQGGGDHHGDGDHHDDSH